MLQGRHTVPIAALIQLPTAGGVLETSPVVCAGLSRPDSRARSCQSAAGVDKDSERGDKSVPSAGTQTLALVRLQNTDGRATPESQNISGPCLDCQSHPPIQH